jgi:hypothetical protein
VAAEGSRSEILDERALCWIGPLPPFAGTAIDSPAMDLKDATLMILIESAAHPSVAKIAQAAYDQLASGQEVDYRVLDELVGEASGKGVLRAIGQKYGATAHEAIFAPILREIDREKPVPPRSRPARYQDSADPLTASSW